MSKSFGDSEKEKLPFNRKKFAAEPGSGWGGNLPQMVQTQPYGKKICNSQQKSLSRVWEDSGTGRNS